MSEKEICEIVIREMTAYASGWRMDWSEFDGRTLRDQLGGLAMWATEALNGNVIPENYTMGTKFCKARSGEFVL